MPGGIGERPQDHNSIFVNLPVNPLSCSNGFSSEVVHRTANNSYLMPIFPEKTRHFIMAGSTCVFKRRKCLMNNENMHGAILSDYKFCLALNGHSIAKDDPIRNCGNFHPIGRGIPAQINQIFRRNIATLTGIYQLPCTYQLILNLW